MKKVFYAILILIALYFVLGLFGPREIKAERSIVINAPAQVVLEKLGDFQYFHEKWSPWTEKDPDMKTTFTGVPGTPGHLYAWTGNDDVGNGEMKLERYSGDSLVQTLSFDGQGQSMAYFIVKDQGNSSHVTWGMHFDVGFMFRTPMLFVDFGDMIGEDYENGLVRLKQALEEEEKANSEASL